MSTKLLSLAVTNGLITEDNRTTALTEKTQRKLAGDKILSGEFLVRRSLITTSQRDNLLAEQQKLRTAKRHREDPDLSTKTQHLVLAVVSVLAVLVANLYFKFSLVDSTEVTGFVAFVFGVEIEKFGSKITLSNSILKVSKKFLFLVVTFIFLYSLVNVSYLTQNTLSLSHSHSQPEIQEMVSNWLRNIRFSLVSLIFPVLFLFLYSQWKFKSQRYAEARITALKNTVIRVEEILRNSRVEIEKRRLAEISDFKVFKANEIQKAKDLAIDKILKGLRATLKLSITDSSFRLLRKISARDKTMSKGH